MKYTIAYISANHTIETMTNEYPYKHAAFVAGANLMASGKAVSWFVHENEATAKTEAVTRFEKKTGIQITSNPAPKTVAQKEYTVNLWADGSCLGNPGPGGWAAILEMDMPDGSVYRKEFSGHGTANDTNNQMEIVAVANGLNAIRKPCHVTVYTDSTYIVNAFEKGWIHKWAQNGWKKADKKPVENIGLWKNLLAHVNIMKSIKFIHVTGHAGNANNERCDQLAKAAAKEVQLG